MVALGGQAESYGVALLLRQSYWCGVFGELYSGTTETRFANDLQDVVVCITAADAGEPRTVRDSQFQSGRPLRLRTRNSAAYKGMYALEMKRGARDFRTGLTIDVHAYLDDAIDIHHIFPQKWCTANKIANKIADTTANSIVNKTAIDARTNRRIGGNAPSKYLAIVESAEKITRQDLDAILPSHDIDPLALRRDDFREFSMHATRGCCARSRKPPESLSTGHQMARKARLLNWRPTNPPLASGLPMLSTPGIAR